MLEFGPSTPRHTSLRRQALRMKSHSQGSRSTILSKTLSSPCASVKQLPPLHHQSQVTLSSTQSPHYHSQLSLTNSIILDGGEGGVTNSTKRDPLDSLIFVTDIILILFTIVIIVSILISFGLVGIAIYKMVNDGPQGRYKTTTTMPSFRGTF